MLENPATPHQAVFAVEKSSRQGGGEKQLAYSPVSAPDEMIDNDINLAGSGTLRCVAATAKVPDLDISGPHEIGTSCGIWGQHRNNNYFRSAEWYAT